MTTDRTAQRPCLVFCNCAHYAIIPQASREQILTGLSRAGVRVEAVDDLCGLVASHDPRLPTWAQAPSLIVVACFPRAVRWLFHAAGVSLPPERVRFFNMRTQTPEEILRELMKDDRLLTIEDRSAPSAPSNHQSSIANHQSTWVPWFPVIDYDRCKNCKQCLNFCLFGVYQLSPEGKVEVRNPAGCKTNCPACARMCPQKAIIFPKYADAPINGDEVAPMMVDSSRGANPQSEIPNPQLNDLYDRIRQRSAGRKRFSGAPKEEGPDRSCPTLDGLRRELGVPDDVLRSLSPAELQRITGRKSPDQTRPDAGPSDGGEDQNRHD